MEQYTVDQNTVALLHFENGFTDECGNTWTPTANVVVDTTQKVLGNGSVSVPAANYLTSVNDAYAFGSSDFTIDFWLYGTRPNSSYFAASTIIGGPIGVSICGDAVWVGTNKMIAAKLTMPTIPANTWTHIAVVRCQNKLYLFIQGQLIQQTTVTTEISSNKFAIGARYGNGSYATPNPIFLDEFRISNIARWTQNFTPGEAPVPPNLTATAGIQKITLQWNPVPEATGYNVKRSISSGGPYSTIANNVTGTTFDDTDVIAGVTYYYVITAIISGVESENSNEAFATVVEDGQAILVIEMADGCREYDLPMTEVNSFLNWYNTRAAGTGLNYYMFNKIFNLGPFSARKDYIVFDKIIRFEIMAY